MFLIFVRRLQSRKIVLHRTASNHPSQDGTIALSGSSLPPSPDRHWNNIVIGLQRHTKGRIINGWLVLIVVLGAVIAVADGLTRVSIFDRVENWYATFEYVPSEGAVLFAGLTLPLVIAYARKARISISEGLFLWFVFCTTAYTRDFSYIHLPGMPLFVTDIVLLILLVSIYLVPRVRRRHCPTEVNVLLFLFFVGGGLAAARGVLGHRETVLVLRDSALVAYALFVVITLHLVRSWLSAKRIAIWFLLGSLMSALNGLGWFIAVPSERRFIYPGIYILISLIGVLVAMVGGLLRPHVGWTLAAVMSLGLMLANARSLFVTLAILLLVGLLGWRLVHKKFRLVHLVSVFATAFAMVTLAAFLFLRTEAGRDLAERSAEQLASGVLDSGEDPTWQFRLTAWKEAWRRFADYPLAGEGFGVPFTFEGLLFENDPRPHNTFLTVLYKMGLAGFLPLFALLAYFFLFMLRTLYRTSDNRRVVLLQIVVLAQVAFCIYGAANLLLESPFLASLFWALMGLTLRIVSMLGNTRAPIRPFPAGSAKDGTN